MSNQNNTLNFAYGTIISDLCLARDNHYQLPHLKLSFYRTSKHHIAACAVIFLS